MILLERKCCRIIHWRLNLIKYITDEREFAYSCKARSRNQASEKLLQEQQKQTKTQNSTGLTPENENRFLIHVHINRFSWKVVFAFLRQ